MSKLDSIIESIRMLWEFRLPGHLVEDMLMVLLGCFTIMCIGSVMACLSDCDDRGD